MDYLEILLRLDRNNSNMYFAAIVAKVDGFILNIQFFPLDSNGGRSVEVSYWRGSRKGQTAVRACPWRNIVDLTGQSWSTIANSPSCFLAG